MEKLLQYFLWLPAIGFFISLFIPRKNEYALSLFSSLVSGIHFFALATFILIWFMNDSSILDIKHITLFDTKEIQIFIDLYFDKITAVFALVGSLLTFLITVYSRFYLHRDQGFKLFFNVILLFFFSYNLIIFSGNFETLFIGWEILGVCSFLLIAFYRDRYLPIKNSLKVLSIYRFGDICLILAMWMSHHLWHENITFYKLNDSVSVVNHLMEHQWYAFFIALMIFIAASAKSAQLPFSSWLPRAMEGPTSSSAIFYGSLSVHLGVFLLLRTYPYWENLVLIKFIIIIMGIFTIMIATSIAKVQSSVKTQIAYSSIAQIGLMFIEIALGFHHLVLIHFVGNAFLRTYHLLVSPSTLGYLIHDMVFNPPTMAKTIQNPLLQKIINSIYVLSIKEWNLDLILYRYLWNPFKIMGRKLFFLRKLPVLISLILIYIIGLYFNIHQETISPDVFYFLPNIFSFIAFMLILASFTERGNAMIAWSFAICSQLFITLSIVLLNEDFGHNYIFIYLSGSFISSIIGFVCLKKIQTIDRDIELNQFHGYIIEKPKTAFLFLIACLGLIGLPFTPTFIGIDILFSHIHKHEELLILFTALNFVFMEIAIIRIYARIFLGQSKKLNQAIAYRSS